MTKCNYQVFFKDELIAETVREEDAKVLSDSLGEGAKFRARSDAPKNFNTLLNAVTQHLEGTFQASACGPLPMEKGAPREKALASAFAQFLPQRVGMATNSHLVREELISPETDLLFYDGVDGWSWPIAGDNGTRFMHAKFAHCILEVKSKLGPAQWQDCLDKYRSWCAFFQEPPSIPLFVFAYEIPEDTRSLIWDHGNKSEMQIEGVFSLDGYAVVHKHYRGSELAYSIAKDLPLSLVGSDTGYWDSEITRDCSNSLYPEHYRLVASRPDQAMLALITCVALACEKGPTLERFADEILSFYRKPGEHQPIHPIP